jgi:hypothetical protein
VPKSQVAEKPESPAEGAPGPQTPAEFDRTVSKRKGQGRPGRNETGPPVRVRVTFEEPAEFVDEVTARAERVEGGVVRYTLRYDPPGEGYGMRKVELVAGVVVDGEILEMVAKAGAVWGDDGEADQATKKRVAVWHADLVGLCGQHGLTLKGGRFGAV